MCSLLVLVTKQATWRCVQCKGHQHPRFHLHYYSCEEEEVGWACWAPLFLLFSHRLIFINIWTKASTKAPGSHLEFALRPSSSFPPPLPRDPVPPAFCCLHTSVLSSPISFLKMPSFPPVLLRNNWHTSLCKLKVYSVIYTYGEVITQYV